MKSCIACGFNLTDESYFCQKCGQEQSTLDINKNVGKTCPFCQFPIKPGESMVVCPECGTPHHRECWESNGSQCTTFGCKGKTSAIQSLANPQSPAQQVSPRGGIWVVIGIGALIIGGLLIINSPAKVDTPRQVIKQETTITASTSAQLPPPSTQPVPSNMPPAVYIEENAHPFEGCVYRKWNVVKTAQIRKEPFSDSPIIATVQPGDIVQAMTGITIARPAKIVVTKFHQEKSFDGKVLCTLKEGDVVYLLASMGEGVYRIWHNGEKEFIKIFGVTGQEKLGASSSNESWAYLVDDFKDDWWVKMTTPSGVEGWTNQTKNFGNMALYGRSLIPIVVNNNTIQFGSNKYPYVQDGITMVELSTIAQSMKWSYSLVETRVMLASNSGNTAQLLIGSKTIIVNGRRRDGIAATIMKNGEVFVPVTFLRDFSGAKIVTDSDTRQVKIDIINP